MLEKDLMLKTQQVQLPRCFIMYRARCCTGAGPYSSTGTGGVLELCAPETWQQMFFPPAPLTSSVQPSQYLCVFLLCWAASLAFGPSFVLKLVTKAPVGGGESVRRAVEQRPCSKTPLWLSGLDWPLISAYFSHLTSVQQRLGIY